MEIAILGPEEHEVFGEVASILESRGKNIDFLDPEKVHSPRDISDYEGIVAKKSRPESFQTLRYASLEGVPTYNGFQTHMRTNHNPASCWHLERAGVEVPEWSTYRDTGSEMVRKPAMEIMREEPYMIENFEDVDGYFCQRYIENGGIDHKLYGVRLEDGVEAVTVDTPSKLLSDSGGRKRVETAEDFRAILESVMDVFRANMAGVDVISPEEGNYVVDVNSAPSYRGTGMEEKLADSIQQFTEGKL